ncbi:hypothetical protein [Aliamphritea hakodatensis]|uniref:hypothetical protein n=1 Tax=Aliamphritea hakodatensis TaxID=2895352 RepID=UPI0022FD719E|nr:hypothetical protein [Aliamphritea hakodatensis]
MSAKDFIENVADSMESLVSLYSKGAEGPTYLGFELDRIGLSFEQREKVLDLIQLAVSEATHSLICGIEGSTSLGKSLTRYKLLDAEGNELTGELGALLSEKLEEQTFNSTAE